MTKGKRNISKKERDQIKEAAGSLPGLLFSKQDDHVHEHHAHIHDDHTLSLIRNKQRTMLGGIFFIMAMIGGIWFLNMQSLVYDVTHAQSKEAELLNDISEGYEDAMAITRSRAQLAEQQLLEQQAALIEANRQKNTPAEQPPVEKTEPNALDTLIEIIRGKEEPEEQEPPYSDPTADTNTLTVTIQD